MLEDARDNKPFADEKIAAPTLCIAGSASTGAFMAGSFAGACAQVAGHVLAECGHWVPEKRPEALLDLIQPALL